MPDEKTEDVEEDLEGEEEFSETEERRVADHVLISKTSAWRMLVDEAGEMKKTHLRHLLKKEHRNSALSVEKEGIYLDYSRQKIRLKTMDLLFDLAERADVQGMVEEMLSGQCVNSTEDRAVGHIALRMPENDKFRIRNVDVVPHIQETLKGISIFSEQVRLNKLPYRGCKIKTILVVGIGGSYLGTRFVIDALKHIRKHSMSAKGKKIKFISNVDPSSFFSGVADASPAETLVIVISKSFTTRETRLNADLAHAWLKKSKGSKAGFHMCAVTLKSSFKKAQEAYGIPDTQCFPLWDWVGGRYSVTSAVGALPISLLFGYAVFERFLEGCRSMDSHFLKASPRDNIPLILGLLGVWNSSFLQYSSRCVVPYAHVLGNFVKHVQQLDMESNGKSITKNGAQQTPFPTGELVFGEPGTNSQHSFFQLLHQGSQIVPTEFIGFAKPQRELPVQAGGDFLAPHDELMANFFAQPDALALGRTLEEVRDLHKDSAESVDILKHKVFPGDRPSSVLLFTSSLNAYTCGQLLSLYEHRTAVQGFIWGINSFDQFGVQLGKELCKDIRVDMKNAKGKKEDKFPNAKTSSTKSMLRKYMKCKL